MPRQPRLVVPGMPHHVTQRGSRKQQTFFNDNDYIAYIKFLAEQLPTAKADVLAYCLMPNHVHLILVPETKESLAKLLRKVHGRYARRINRRNAWQGHLWQERFHSFVMDESHLLAAAKYVELNPVRAGLCVSAQEWRWSSANFHLGASTDALVSSNGMGRYVDDWRSYLEESIPDSQIKKLRQHSYNGLPAGSKSFIQTLEASTGRKLTKTKPGPKAVQLGNCPSTRERVR